jgi:hypothetical protein
MLSTVLRAPVTGNVKAHSVRRMDLVPPSDTPKPRLRRLLQTVIIGGIVGLAYGALAGYFTDDPFLLVLGPIGGAFAGFLIWTLPPNVLWGRNE